MSNTSDYWYIKKEMPSEVRTLVKQMVFGSKVGIVEFSGIQKALIKVDGSVFRKVFIINREYLYKGEFTAPSDENDYINSINYLTEDGLAGFSVTSTGWLVSLFSNYSHTGFSKAVKDYVINDAYKLVCIVSENDYRLVEFYKCVYGFREYAETINDTEVMRKYYGNEFMECFIKNNGIPHHVFMVGKNTNYEKSNIKRFSDYFEAEEFVERTVFKEL